jgi:hypothetical protein
MVDWQDQQSRVFVRYGHPMKFWYGSGSADPYLCLMDPDAVSDPAVFVSDQLKRQPKFFLCSLLF